MPNLNVYLEKVGRMLHENPNVSAETVAIRLLREYTSSWSLMRNHKESGATLIILLQNNSQAAEQDEKKVEPPVSVLAQKVNSLKATKDYKKDGDMRRLLQALFIFFPEAKKGLDEDLRKKFSVTTSELFAQEIDNACSNTSSKQSGFYSTLFLLHYVRPNADVNDSEFQKIQAKARAYISSQEDRHWNERDRDYDIERSEKSEWGDRYFNLCHFNTWRLEEEFVRVYRETLGFNREHFSQFARDSGHRFLRQIETNPALFNGVYRKFNLYYLRNWLLYRDKNIFYAQVFFLAVLLRCCEFAKIQDENLFKIITDFLNENLCKLNTDDPKYIQHITYLFALLPKEPLQKLDEKCYQHLSAMIQALFETPINSLDFTYVVGAFSEWLRLHSLNEKLALLEISFDKLPKNLLIKLLEACEKNSKAGSHYSGKILTALEGIHNNAQPKEEKLNESVVESNLQSMLNWLKTASDKKQIEVVVKVVLSDIEQYTKAGSQKYVKQMINLLRVLQTNQNIDVQMKNEAFEKLKRIGELPDDLSKLKLLLDMHDILTKDKAYKEYFKADILRLLSILKPDDPEIILRAAILFPEDEGLRDNCLSNLKAALSVAPKSEEDFYKDPNKGIYEILSQAVIPPFLVEAALRFVLHGIEKRRHNGDFYYYESHSNFLDAKIISNDVFHRIVLNIFKTYPEKKDYYLFYFMPYALASKDEECKFRWHLFRLEVHDEDQKLRAPVVELMNVQQREYPKCFLRHYN